MKKWGNQKPVRFDKKELKTDLGIGNFIFVGSSCDMFAEDIPEEWIEETLIHMNLYNNDYLLQSKNPDRIKTFINRGLIKPYNYTICTTIETNKSFPEITGKSPDVFSKTHAMIKIKSKSFKTYVTIEPILDFDVQNLLFVLKACNPYQVNIGADTGKNNLPEPNKDKINELITNLQDFTQVNIKKNLKRIME